MLNFKPIIKLFVGISDVFRGLFANCDFTTQKNTPMLCGGVKLTVQHALDFHDSYEDHDTRQQYNSTPRKRYNPQNIQTNDVASVSSSQNTMRAHL